GAGGVAVGLAGGGPPLVVDRSEPAYLPGLLEGGGSGERPGLAEEDLEVVVQVELDTTLGHQTLVAGHHRLTVVDDELAGMQQDPDLATDVAGRHGVLVHPDAHLGEPVDPRGEPAAGLELLDRQ